MTCVKLFFLIFTVFRNTDVDAKKAQKIINGASVRIRDHSYRVSIQYRSNHFCSGSIITPSHILTTSSCVLHDDGVFYGNLQVLSGMSYIAHTYRVGTPHEVARVIHHNEYNSRRNWVHDIAILKLTLPIPFSSTRGKAKFASSHVISRRIGEKLSIVGWETIGMGHLKRVFVQIQPRHKCLEYNWILHASQDCAAPESINHFVSDGDTGSALTIYKRMIYGIVSVIPNNRKQPFIFSSIRFYEVWVENMVNTY